MRVGWVGGFLVVLGGVAGAQGVTARAADVREVHVAVQLRTENGDPVTDLEARDFKVLAGGSMTLPGEVRQPVEGAHHQAAGVPTRLLVVLQNVDPEGRASVGAKLGKVWKAGWSVSVLDAQGMESGYVSSAPALRLALAGVERRSSPRAAVGRLTSFAGRRVVFVVTQPGAALGGPTARGLLQSGVTVYHVGGNPLIQESTDENASMSPPVTNGATDAVNGGIVIPGGLSTYRKRGRETEEGSFSGAVRDALNDANGYYDLKVAVPVNVREVELGVRPKGREDEVRYVYAEPYEEGGLPPAVRVMNGKAWGGW
ncbi:hypothetical protein [Granulicella tundricola]|uniref:Uncharacterized protein n=1 Tax=Granulicella tundricola (strain ATCC BAA-1859 / DSM 23138 / MP5ACTX9) TaxID=1198114 RepID=E8WWU8_GRATM|nr:hypothetical protein [Granulicella tundricola]ADW67426.1 hypothetical protein AciX9_0354 [Granulicella tundricola MP5ACTX9]